MGEGWLRAEEEHEGKFILKRPAVLCRGGRWVVSQAGDTGMVGRGQ